MKIIKLQVKDLLPKRKKNPKNGTWHTERSYNELLQKNKQLTKQLNEANEAIMSMVGNGPHTADEIGQAYLEKWGVK